MSDIMTHNEDQTANQMDELSVLKQRAQIMGIQFSNNIGIDKLRERINQKMDEPIEPVIAPALVAMPGEPVVATKVVLSVHDQIRADLIRDEMRLVRLRISNLDPKKKNLPGEIFTVANEYLGTVKKYIPYGEFTDDGWHVPYIIYRQLQDRKFLDIRVTKNRHNGEPKVSSAWVKEFALEVLPLLTKEELSALATAQAAAGDFANE